jgi:3-oxoacid CoA-transferase subunit A
MAGAAKSPLQKLNYCPAGSLDPNEIHIPGILVNNFSREKYEKRIEQLTVRKIF